VNPDDVRATLIAMLGQGAPRGNTTSCQSAIASARS
jgi:hypothetical protein